MKETREQMSLHEALRIALSEIYAALAFAEENEDETTTCWITPPDALREAARIIDTHMRTT